MYYIIDKETGNHARVSFWNLLWIKISLVVSLMLYGIIIGGFLSYIGISYEIVIGILFAAYAVELIGWFTNKTSPGKLLLALLILIQWRSIFVELQNDGSFTKGSRNRSKIKYALKVCNSFEHFTPIKSNISI
ncbi:MAG: hypothetical protein K8R11_01885 [Methanococcoides sp.]|nr:hypothetical protein [Methanococcoides sp.]